MIAQNTTEVQEVLTSVSRCVPAVLVDGESHIYFLVNDFSEKMEKFLQQDGTSATEIHVFSDEYEWILIRRWEELGFRWTFRRQQMEYMGRRITIAYLQVCNPETGMKVSLIPWFMMPGRPYPVFVYLYAIWHYEIPEQKSMWLSAEATAKLFGIESFDKSTVCRSIKAFKGVIEANGIDTLSVSVQKKIASTAEITDLIPEILRNSPDRESLEKIWGISARPLPGPVNHRKSAARVLNGIPRKLSETIKEESKKNPAVPVKSSRTRKQPPPDDEKSLKKKHNKPDFVDDSKLRQIRTEFITVCNALVLDMAVRYHRFII